MAASVHPPVNSFDDVVEALVDLGVTEDEARRIADDNREWADLPADQRWEWVQEQAEINVTESREAQRAANQVSAGHSDDPNLAEDRTSVLRIAQAMGFYSGDPDGVEWTDRERDAVREYQTRRGLDVTGSIDAATTADVEEFGRYLAGISRPASTGSPTSTTSGGGREQGAEERRVSNRDRGPAGGGVTNPVDVQAATTGAGAAPAGSPSGGGAANPDGLYSVPGGAEMWRVDGKDWFVVYRVPGSGTPLAWKVDNEQDLAAIFGPDRTPTPTRDLNGLQAYAEGPLVFGSSRMLANTSEHPFDAFVANFQTEASIRPWLRDPEILALTTRAILENRTVTEAELANTDWWRTHTEGERQWIADFNRDPATAQQRVADRRLATEQAMVQAGISNPPARLVNLIADRVTGGTWTEAFATSQIVNLADPAAAGTLDPVVSRWVADLAGEGIELDTLAGNTSRVEDLIAQWLGPVVAKGWSKSQKEHWAGVLRNDPMGEQRFVETVLQPQRMSMFPEYENPDLSYEDIAAPWRSVWQQAWGEVPDESDPLFARIVRSNDLGEAQRTLRREGVARGNSTVSARLLEDLSTSDLAQPVIGVS